MTISSCNTVERETPLRLTRRFFPMATAIVVALSLALLPVGCGDDKKKSDDSSAAVGDFEELREEAEAARDEAKAAGADTLAAEDFEKAMKYLEQAQNFETENPGRAKSRYKSAKKRFEESIATTTKIQGKLASFQEKLKEFETQRDEFVAAGGDKIAAEYFGKAINEYNAAKEASESGDMSNANKRLRYANNDLSNAQNQAAKLTKDKLSADEERGLMAEAKAKATEKGAENVAPQDWAWAADLERDAAKAYDAGQFQRAFSLFRQAKSAFLSANNAATGQLASTIKDASGKPDLGGRIPSGSGGNVGATPGVDEIEIPDLGSGDEADLTDLANLFQGVASYSEGKLEIDWADGLAFKEDISVLAGKVGGDKPNVIFEGSENVGEGFGEAGYVFAGNTGGFLLIDAGFEDQVGIRAEIQFSLLTQRPFLELILMADGDRWYASEMASNVWIIEDKGRLKKPMARARQGEYRQPFNKWINRREPYIMEMSYNKRSDSQKGVITCKLNGEVTATFETDKIRKGKIGFRWSNTKFVVKSLFVRGAVDEEWAIDALKKHHEGGDSGGDDGGDFGF